ncbi:MAG: helix-turn-helix domain-containing protein [Ruminococcaceae bacterium]|nr:helix-turn-helix domain-containing protein [Oscillospiraceae bacterium]
MKRELLQVLWARGEKIAKETLSWAKEQAAGEDYADLAAFFAAHPTLSLPDKLLAGKGDVFLSLHTEDFNGVPHCHDFVEIIYVCRGSVIDCVGESRISLGQGDACIHNPSATHFLTDFDGERDVVLNILLSRRIFGKSVYAAVIRDNKLDGFFNRLLSDGGSEPYRAFKNLSDAAETIVELLVKELLQSDGYSSAVLESILLLLFAELLRNYRKREEEDFTGRLESYLFENLQSVTVETAAAAFGYHPKYFSVLVRKETGRSFRSLLTEQRMKKAEVQLLFTDYSIEEIAESVGYRDAVSLYGNFKEYAGMTPSEFRRGNSKKGGAS